MSSAALCPARWRHPRGGLHVAGILEILAGLVYVWLSFNPAQIPDTLSTQDALEAVTATDDLKSFLLWGGIVGIVLGLITILLANGLKNGSNGSGSS